MGVDSVCVRCARGHDFRMIALRGQRQTTVACVCVCVCVATGLGLEVWKDDRLRWKSESDLEAASTPAPGPGKARARSGALRAADGSVAARVLGVVPLRVILLVAYLLVLDIAVMASFARVSELSRLCDKNLQAAAAHADVLP